MSVEALLSWIAGDRPAYLVRRGEVHPVRAAEYLSAPLPAASILTPDEARALRVAASQRAQMEARS